MTGQPKVKRKATTFEHTAGAMPSLQRAAPRPAAEAAQAQPAVADEQTAAPGPAFLSHKEVILRLVETVKAL